MYPSKKDDYNDFAQWSAANEKVCKTDPTHSREFVSHYSVIVLHQSPLILTLFCVEWLFLFSRIKKLMCSMYLGTLEEIKVTMMAELWKISIQAYKACLLTENLTGITVWVQRGFFQSWWCTFWQRIKILLFSNFFYELFGYNFQKLEENFGEDTL